MPRICATIEARMGSTRLPGKVLAEACGKPMLELMIERVRRVSALDEIIVATTLNEGDDKIVEFCSRQSIGCYRGSEEDVLTRILEAARAYDADVIVELTGDSPLIDPGVISEVVEAYLSSGADYVSNILERSYPIGMDTQVFATKILEDVSRRTDDPIDREHVSLYIYSHPEVYSLENVAASGAMNRHHDLRLTLDTPEDLALIVAVYDALYSKNTEFSLIEIIEFLDSRPDIAMLNANVIQRAVPVDLQGNIQ